MTGKAAHHLRMALITVMSGVLLVGCGLPRSSDIVDGRRVGDNVAPRARIVVDPPSVGASQDVIARDFIRSGAAFQDVGDDQQVVGRSFLAPASLDLWRPTAMTTTVFDSRTTPTIEHLPSDQVRLTVGAVATIDENGHYRELPPGTTTSVVFSMTKVEGEWRITLPGEGFGLWLNTDDFDRVFGAYDINYLQTDRRQLVPDVRWFPTGPRLATALARAQLAAVPAYLTGVLDTAVPAGTRLAVDAVNVDISGVATVTLTNSVQTIDPARRRPMYAQFLATLSQAPTVTAVSLEVQGIGKIPVANLPAAVASLSDLGYSRVTPTPATNGLLRTKDVIERVNPQTLDESSPVPPAKSSRAATDPPKIPETYVQLTLAPDGNDIAGVSAKRTELAHWRGATGTTVPTFGTELTNAMYAPDGRLWVAGVADGSSRVWTFDAAVPIGAGPAVVKAPWLEARRVVNLSVSPDGSRVAILSRLPDRTDNRLDIAGIVRDSAGLPISLADPYRQGEPLTGFVDVTWLDQMTLVVLAKALDADSLRPFRVDIGQGVGLRRVGQLDLDQTLIREVPDATSITSRGGVRGLIVTTPKGVLLRAGNAWSEQTGVTEIVVGGT